MHEHPSFVAQASSGAGEFGRSVCIAFEDGHLASGKFDWQFWFRCFSLMYTCLSHSRYCCRFQIPRRALSTSSRSAVRSVCIAFAIVFFLVSVQFPFLTSICNAKLGLFSRPPRVTHSGSSIYPRVVGLHRNAVFSTYPPLLWFLQTTGIILNPSILRSVGFLRLFPIVGSI